MEVFIISFILLLILSAFFSGSETAMFSLDFLKRTKIFRTKSRSALRLESLLKKPRELLMTILIGNMFVNIALSSVATDFFGDEKVVAIAVITIVLLIFGEITPKNISYSFNRKIALTNSFLILFFYKIFKPIRKILDFFTKPFLRSSEYGIKPKTTLTTDEIKTAVIYGHRAGVLDKDESGLISNVLNFSIKDARHIMTPRTKIKAIPIDTSFKEAITQIKKFNVSKVPVYKKNKDHITGYLNTKELLPYIRGLKKASGISHLVRPVHYIPEGKGLAEFFTELKKSTSRIAVVVDEYGGTAGIITLDDVLEEIFGQFLDEGQKAEQFYWIRKNGKYIFRGSAPLEVFNEKMGMAVSSQDYETFGGYILELAGDIPKEGEEFEDDYLSYRIKLMKDNHISLIEVETL